MTETIILELKNTVQCTHNLNVETRIAIVDTLNDYLVVRRRLEACEDILTSLMAALCSRQDGSYNRATRAAMGRAFQYITGRPEDE